MRRIRRAGALLVLVLLTSTACSSGLSATGEALTVPQSEQVAQARFQLSTADTFSADLVSGDADDADRYVAELTVSTTDHVAWGTLHRGPDGIATTEDIVVTPTSIAVGSAGAWQASVLEQSSLRAFPVLFSLSADRPENAQLLRQSGARFLGTQQDEKVDLSVYRLADSAGAAGTTRLWLTEDGKLRRLDDGTDSFTIRVVDRAAEPRPAIADELLAASDPSIEESPAP